VPGCFPLQIQRPRVWHTVDHSLICSSGSTDFCSGSHSGMMTDALSRMRTSTCRTPSFLAALITRFTSACVIAADLPLIPDPFKYAHVVTRREMRRYAISLSPAAQCDGSQSEQSSDWHHMWLVPHHGPEKPPPLLGWCPTRHH